MKRAFTLAPPGARSAGPVNGQWLIKVREPSRRVSNMVCRVRSRGTVGLTEPAVFRYHYSFRYRRISSAESPAYVRDGSPAFKPGAKHSGPCRR